MRAIVFMLVFVATIGYSCNRETNNMTEKEIKQINSESASVPFYVLQTTDEADSLFLRTKCVDLDIQNIAKNEDLQLLIARMKATLMDEEGVGLAAPQVGIGRNLFLFMRIDKPDFPVQVAINPKIVNTPDEMICFEGDGCLSIPDVSGDTFRYPWIDVEYYDEKGELHKERLSGYSRDDDFTGIVFQHEFDHLQGVLFIDKFCDEDLEDDVE